MKILVINPSSVFTTNVVRDALFGCWCKGKRIGGGTVPPFFLLSTATVLRHEGHDVTFLDAQAEQLPLAQVKALIAGRGYRLVISSTSSMTMNEDARFLDGLKQADPGLTSVVFGSHTTFMPDHALRKDGVDIIVRREPEFVVRDLARCMEAGGEEWKSVRGIGYMQDGKPVVNEHYPFIDKLDVLPFLDVTLFPRHIEYFNPIVSRLPYITTMTSRGCPSKCTFCTAPFFYGPRFRVRSAPSVVDEIRTYVEAGFREVYIRDEIFPVNKRRTLDVCQGIIDQGIDVSWICNAKVGLIDKQMMEMMKKAGCHLLKFGVESGVQEVLDRVIKGFTIEQTVETFKWAHEVGIDTHAHTMLGIPGDTRETVARTIEFIKEIDPTTATFGVCTPYPGTPLYDEVAAKVDMGDGTHMDLANLHTTAAYNELYTSLTRAELERSVRKAYRSFYLRPSYVARRAVRISSIEELKRVMIAGTKVFDFTVRGDE
jgi:anaerobic magnesium-protoporphyrin IX monomethyl ester cyclase